MNNGRIEITYLGLFVFITIIWILLRVLFGIKNGKVYLKNEFKLLSVYICIVVIVRIVYFPMELKDGHLDTLILDTAGRLQNKKGLSPALVGSEPNPPNLQKTGF